MRVSSRKAVFAAAFLTISAAFGSIPASGSDDHVADLSGNWTTWQRDLAGSRYNGAEHEITPGTVGGLKLKWAYTYANVPYSRDGSQPAVVHGTLYTGTPDGKLIALDARSGATRWVFDVSTAAGPVDATHQDLVRDGPAVADGKVYFGDSRGFIFAVDEHSGKLKWATHADPHPSALITSSPMVYKGRLYVGLSSSEAGDAMNPYYPCCTHSGEMIAMDAGTGTVLWRYRTVPAAQPVGTWPSGVTMYAPSGGAVWSSPIIDPKTRTLYFGTGQNYTGHGGDTDSVIALDARTGALRWKYQATSGDTYTQACTNPAEVAAGYCPGQSQGVALDFDFGASPNLVRTGDRTLLTIGQKGGIFWAFDAHTGQVVWQTRLAQPNPHDPDTGSSGIVWGSSYDGHQIYVATWRANPGTLFALDPATGHINWSQPHPADGCSTGGVAATPQMCVLAFTPAVTTTPGLVYEGSWTGKMYVFAATDGRLLWQYDAIRDFDGVNGIPGRGLPISGNGGAVVSNGMLYVQAGYYPYYSTGRGYVLLAFGL
jgi:polyvinyl alcohol dehydrogenase (cytochrome)